MEPEAVYENVLNEPMEETMPKQGAWRHDVKTLYHASTGIVRKPQWDYYPPNKPPILKGRKDFGLGFYICTEPEYPIYLYSAEDTVVLNKYELNLITPKELRVLRLYADTNWLLVIAAHRRNFSDFQAWHPVRDSIRCLIASYDVLIGDISNDRFFSAFERFLANRYTAEFTLRLAKRLSYPEQIVLKSDDAVRQLKFITHESVNQEQVLSFRSRKMSDDTTVAAWVDEMERNAKADGSFYSGKKFDTIIGELNRSGGFKL